MAVSLEILATAGQTVVLGLPTLPLSKNDFMVFVNNVLADTASYERTGNTEITFDEALNENDKIRVLIPFTTPVTCSTNMVFPDSPTLSELYGKVRTEMRIDRTGRIWSNPDIKDALNLAILQVQKATNFGWQVNDACTTISTVQGQASYDIPDNLQGVKLVEYEDDAIYSTQKEYIEAINKTTPSGTPRYYYMWNGSLGVSPVPSVSNKTIKIYYQKFLVPMESDTDTLPLRPDFVKSVVLYAAYDLFSQTSDAKNFQRAEVKMKRYKEELNTIRLAYLVPDSNQIEYKTTYRSGVRKGTTRRGISGTTI